MTHSAGYTTSWGAGQPPFERSAAGAIAGARQQLGLDPHPRRPPLTPAERREAEDAAKQSAQVCRLCLAIHALPNSPGCPRLATFKLDGDGRVVEGSFRTDTLWQDRVVFLEDAHEDGGEAAGDGG